MATSADLTELLRARGMRVTPQRVLIWEALRELDRHATADEVLEQVAPRLPSASPPTVYAALELLAELGLVRRVAGTGDAIRWDPRTDGHPHFVCSHCGAVSDLDAPVEAERALRAARRAGLQPEVAELVLTGLCAGCAAGGEVASHQRSIRSAQARGRSA